ncbi:MAG: YHYH protein, partial [Planctomycetaceae bacterium]|nr:YHYH protein [Planctomycetaceae bacterium]
PGGRFDGTFVQDYEFMKGLGDLDEYNGRVGVTPEYPQGIYYYVITNQFPFIPRELRGEADASFARQPPPGGFGGPGTRGPGRPRFPPPR